MSTQAATDGASQPVAVPPIADQQTWETALAELRSREKAATREIDALAAARRRLPMVELPEYTLDGVDGLPHHRPPSPNRRLTAPVGPLDRAQRDRRAGGPTLLDRNLFPYT